MKKIKQLTTRRVNSLNYAISGIIVMFREEFNALIYTVATAIVLILSFYFQLSLIEWLFVLLAIFLVFISEMFNTALENLADAHTKDHHILIKKAKDVAAGAVLLAAIYALIIGLLIFGPKIIKLF